jgi:hypothetical protein
MTDTIVKITEASDEQLRWYAANVLGLDISVAAKRPGVISKIAAVHDCDSIAVPPEIGCPRLEPASDRPAHAVIPGSYQSGGKRRVIIERQEGPGGDRPVFVAVNGVGILVPRGEPCNLAEPYIEALENAVQTVYHQDGDGNLIPRDVQIHPMRVLGRAA